jgi:acyl-CoA thioesterase
VSDGVTEDTAEVTVVVNEVTASAGSDVTIQSGESVKLTASGGDSYEWSTGETTQSITVAPSQTRRYEVKVRKGNCFATAKVKVTVENDEVSDAEVSTANAGEDQTICLGESITLRGSGGETYLWSTGETDKNLVVSPSRTSTYTLYTTTEGVTTSDFVTVIVENCDEVEVETGLTNNSFNVYPNPTDNILNIEASTLGHDYSIQLLSSSGSLLLYQESMNPNKSNVISKQIDVSNFDKGIYFLRITNSEEDFVHKVVLI